MCNYCSRQFLNQSLTKEFGVIINGVFIELQYVSNKIEIKYCPMCGIDLTTKKAQKIVDEHDKPQGLVEWLEEEIGLPTTKEILAKDKKVSIKQVEEFMWETAEDYHLWDEDTQGQYPVKRMLKSMDNFLKQLKDPTDTIPNKGHINDIYVPTQKTPPTP